MHVTPGVYIEESNAFPNSAVAVATAVPVFIGYTEIAVRKEKSLTGIPTRISSFTEYVDLFGREFTHKFTLDSKEGVSSFTPAMLITPPQIFYFYNCIRLFFQNGGSNCYILSVGTYGNDSSISITKNDFINATLWTALEKEFEPTLVVIPDMINNRADCYAIYQEVLKHCSKMQSRFAIFDVITGTNDANDKETIAIFRTAIGNNALDYGAAYYPWLHTSIIPATEISCSNLAIERDALIQMFLTVDKQGKEIKEKISASSDKELHQLLMASGQVYNQIMEEIRFRLNVLPPAAAMAGIYSLVDSSWGVWKSPANVSVAMVNSPVINISHEEQQSMNVDVLEGKSINVIRPFSGIGTLVWGSRTLDGNSQDWKYINVRRTIIMIEQSLKLACRAYVFEPNDANTWVTMHSMISNFLFNLWKQGALAGAVPDQAYDVQIGLGSTMTPNDIMDGYLRITVKLAIVRPAEFIVLTFQQQQQQS